MGMPDDLCFWGRRYFSTLNGFVWSHPLRVAAMKASSADLERRFSNLGFVYGQHRSQLSP
jgi:hypothetical protein